jgi:hypothetical protein
MARIINPTLTVESNDVGRQRVQDSRQRSNAAPAGLSYFPFSEHARKLGYFILHSDYIESLSENKKSLARIACRPRTAEVSANKPKRLAFF